MYEIFLRIVHKYDENLESTNCVKKSVTDNKSNIHQSILDTDILAFVASKMEDSFEKF